MTPAHAYVEAEAPLPEFVVEVRERLLRILKDEEVSHEKEA